jgi:hypothetical protein
VPRINRYEALSELGQGAVGIGEEHRKEDGRKLARLLILSKCVKALFLEDDNANQTGLDAAYGLKVNSPAWRKAIEDNVNGPMYFNPIDLSEVAMDAVREKIPVRLIDEAGLSTREGELPRRDRLAAGFFEDWVRRHGRKGCLLLYGANHFTGPEAFYPKGAQCLAELLKLKYVLCT